MTRRHFGTIEALPPRPGFYVRFTWRGRRYRRYGGALKAIAQSKLAALQSALERGQEIESVLADVFGDVVGARLTFRDAVEPFLAYAATRRKASTLRGHRQSLRMISRASWAGSLLGEIRPPQLQAWTVQRIKGGVSGATVNRNLNVISALYRWAIRSGHVSENPASKVERFSERGRARETYLTAAESRALIEVCSPGTRDVVLAALHTGMRRGELLALRWRRVDVERREIVVESATEKTGRGRVVPMTDVLHARLVELRREHPRSIHGDDPVFVLLDGSELTSKILRNGFEGAVRRCAAIPVDKREKVTFHCLRHTAASLMVAEGVPLFDVAKILGHSTLAVTMRYAHFAPEAGRAGIEKLGKALAATRTSSTGPIGAGSAGAVGEGTPDRRRRTG